MRQIIWLSEAESDLRRFHDFLSPVDLHLADRAIIRIYDASEQLIDFPYMGRALEDGTGRRELAIAFGRNAYILRYIVEEDTVIILRAWHSREDR